MIKNMTFLGLGAMGSRMAKHLSTFNGQVKLWNRSTHQEVFEGNVEIISDLHTAVKDADVVFAMIRDDQVSRSIWLNEGHGILNTLKKRSMVVECSTLSPHWVKELSQKCADKGIDFVEAPVIGSRPQAEAGALIQLVGSEVSHYDRILSILSMWSKEVIHVGAVCSAAHMKLLINTLLGMQVAGVAELLGYANRNGLNLNNVLEIINKTVVASPALVNSAQSMINNAFDPLFPVELIHKDLGYVLSSAQNCGASLPLSVGVQSVFAKALQQGFAEQNMSAVVQLFLSNK